jgi:uncharacterized protein (DUF885 family)
MSSNNSGFPVPPEERSEDEAVPQGPQGPSAEVSCRSDLGSDPEGEFGEVLEGPMELRSFMKKIFVGISVLVLPLVGVSQTNQTASARQSEEVRRFRAFLAEDCKRWMQEYPEYATAVGFPGQNRRWTDASAAGREARIKHMRESMEAMKQLHREQLPPTEQLNYDLYLKRLQNSEEGLQYGGTAWGGARNIWIPITQMDGVQQDRAELLAMMPHQTVSDYEDILARLEALPVVVDQNMDLLKEGLKKGYSPPKIAMRDVPKQVEDLIPADPMRSALLEPFQKFPASIGEADRTRVQASPGERKQKS